MPSSQLKVWHCSRRQEIYQVCIDEKVPLYISADGCHLTEEGQARYAQGLRQAVLQCLALC